MNAKLLHNLHDLFTPHPWSGHFSHCSHLSGSENIMKHADRRVQVQQFHFHRPNIKHRMMAHVTTCQFVFPRMYLQDTTVTRTHRHSRKYTQNIFNRSDRGRSTLNCSLTFGNENCQVKNWMSMSVVSSIVVTCVTSPRNCQVIQ